jgi:sugar phosphate isomerase/epimerase
MPGHDDIRIGTLVKGGEGTLNYLRQILSYGFESYKLTFSNKMHDLDLPRLADQVRSLLAGSGNGAIISSVGIYGNTLTDESIERGFYKLIDAAELFGCKLVCGFTGRIVNVPVHESLPRFKEVFTRLARHAEDRGVRIAFENCDMGGTWEYGDWNIAHAPTAWEQMFEAVPSDAVGLEWEPCHQMVSLIDPLPQLRHWAHKVFHVHGKDATVMWDIVRTVGIRGGQRFVHHRTPGFGDTNWSDVITLLRMAGFRGSIDIEGWHDPVYRGELEMTGQVAGLHYLKRCRGGDFVPNPS